MNMNDNYCSKRWCLIIINPLCHNLNTAPPSFHPPLQVDVDGSSSSRSSRRCSPNDQFNDSSVRVMAPKPHRLKPRHSTNRVCQANRIVITLAISFFFFCLCLGVCSASGSAENGGSGGRSKFGLYIVRSPESTIAPIGDEVVLECGLSVNPDRIVWRFLPQNASKEHRRNFRIIKSNSVRIDEWMDNEALKSLEWPSTHPYMDRGNSLDNCYIIIIV